MSTMFIPQGVYENIINTLGQWKILDSKTLHHFCDHHISYKNFLKKINRLESAGLVKAVFVGNKKKHLYLSQGGIEHTYHNSTSEISQENLRHDLITGMVMRDLLGWSGLTQGRMFHEFDRGCLIPDGELVGVKESKNIKVALEVELTQKSKDRVKEKFGVYCDKSNYDFCLFVTNKESLFKTYQRYLQEMNMEVQAKVLLVLDITLRCSQSNLSEGICFYMGELRKFRELFFKT